MLRFAICSVLVLSAVNSCYDDSELQSEINELRAELTQLKEECSKMNTNISSLQTIVTALDSQDKLTGIKDFTENGKVIGYILSFSKSGTVTIFHGKDGQDGKDGTDGVDGKDGQDGKDGKDGTDGVDGNDGHSPAINVKKDSDGVWYWTIDGQWMRNESGKKIKAQGETPVLKISDGSWYISYDGETTWEKLGKATGDDGDSFFKSVSDSDSGVTLTLSDGTEIFIPKLQKINIEFDDYQDIGIMPGGIRTINYTVSCNNSTDIVVKAIGQNGWKAKVNAKTATSGSIQVTAPAELTDDEIIVLVYDGEYSTIIKTLNFMQGTITVAEGAYTIPAKGGNVSVPVSTNVGLKVSKAADATWLTCTSDKETKAMEYYSITLSAGKNASCNQRIATVKIADEGDVLGQTIVVIQDEYDQYSNLVVGGETANCYIINNSGDYKFPIIKGNGSKGVIISGDTAEIEGATSAKIVWQDANLIESVGIKNNFVQFSTVSSLERGNAVIAVCDADGVILWSWHIWSTDYVLGEGDITVYNHAKSRSYQMMPLNLGAQSKSTTMTDWTNYDSAVFYQWGRKDPFPAQSAKKTATNGSLALSIKNPDVFYTWNDLTDWCSETRYDWWDAGSKSGNSNTSSSSNASINTGVKTIYDPSPAGYRVAPDDAFTNFTTTGVNSETSSEFNVKGSYYNAFSYNFYTGDGSGTVSFKACGGLNASAGTSLSGIGYYQSSHAAYNSIPRQLVFYSEYVKPMCVKFARALAGAVRSVRDTYEPPYESTDYSMDQTTKVLQTHTEGNGIKVLVVGDGFIDKDIANGKYDEKMKLACDYLFTAEPFKSYRNRFDVTELRVVSQSDQFDSSLKTAFACQFGTGTHITGNLGLAYNDAYKVFGTISDVLIIVVINDTRYAGTCYMSSNGAAVAFVPASEQYFTFEDVVHHEAGGHGFAKLGDEYYYSGSIPSSEASYLVNCRENYGWYQNVDITNDASTIYWANFLSDNTYKDYVGIYQGGYTYASGVYRPTYESIMNSNKGTYNAPSRYVIYKRIQELSGYSYSWDSFKSYDTINLSSASNAYELSKPSGTFVPLAKPEAVDAEAILKEFLQQHHVEQ